MIGWARTTRAVAYHHVQTQHSNVKTAYVKRSTKSRQKWRAGTNKFPSPLAARAKYHNDAPTSHSLAKALTPARLSLRQTLPKLEARATK
ncbi:hypothetical protein JMJ77_0008000 [Colletotrichum scovillei]|uniref:Uncharacterized protein n=1 Tax=Colletotrichum scovillei TaxID=1209932 RepID=A0A9P7RDK7_9PEZI|nr:hypothetical protein JMJ77_0008000 [Colletotrichum scovillei]KAG7074978.1 hypothetical protein JMJ76_0011443 [Colletotrichum scovillei]KAG7082193.1 hypothetical protein JMJ78_0004297 [Colletotrichum scovillei]